MCSCGLPDFSANNLFKDLIVASSESRLRPPVSSGLFSGSCRTGTAGTLLTTAVDVLGLVGDACCGVAGVGLAVAAAGVFLFLADIRVLLAGVTVRDLLGLYVCG